MFILADLNFTAKNSIVKHGRECFQILLLFKSLLNIGVYIQINKPLQFFVAGA